MNMENIKPLTELMKIKDYVTVVKALHKPTQRLMDIRQSSNNEVYCFDLKKFLHISNFEYYIKGE